MVSMKDFPQHQWYLALAVDPTDWIAELRPFKELPQMGPLLVSLRRLGAEIADLALLGPPLDPKAVAAVLQSVPPLDKGKQAEPIAQSLPMAGPSDQTPVETTTDAEQAEEPMTGVQGHIDEPLTQQGLIPNVPEVNRCVLSVFARLTRLFLVYQVSGRQSRVYSLGKRRAWHALPEVQTLQDRVFHLCPCAEEECAEAGRPCSYRTGSSY
jgi:hypothetical protein